MKDAGAKILGSGGTLGSASGVLSVEWLEDLEDMCVPYLDIDVGDEWDFV